MYISKITKFIFIIFLLFLSAQAKKEKVVNKAKDIVQKALKSYNPQRELTYQMTINDQDDKKVRMFTLKNKKEPLDNTLIRFFKPAAMKRTGFLIRKKDLETHQWIYLPAFKFIRKLSSSEKNNSFMGSDFTNNDISGLILEDYTYKTIKEQKSRFIILAMPVDKENHYQKLILTIDKKMDAITGIIFYKNNKPLKILKNSDWVEKNKEWIPQKSFMKNLTKETSTLLIVLDIDTNVKLKDRIFEPDNLPNL